MQLLTLLPTYSIQTNTNISLLIVDTDLRNRHFSLVVAFYEENLSETIFVCLQYYTNLKRDIFCHFFLQTLRYNQVLCSQQTVQGHLKTSNRVLDKKNRRFLEKKIAALFFF